MLAVLQAADIAAQDMVAIVQEAGSNAPPQLAWQIRRPVNPASLMKLWPTVAALESLGPAWRWTTPVWLTGPLPAPATPAGPASGVYEGDIVIRGSGDPSLVVERLWLALRRLQQLGVRDIRGDIVLDRSAFGQPSVAPGDFDNEPLRPYNVQADALLLNHKAMFFSFTPDPASGIARLGLEPPLDGVRLQPSLPLSNKPCGDWRAGLLADFSDPAAPRFSGALPTACGPKRWAVAYPDPADYNARLLRGLWREMGGTLRGRVREGFAPATAPSFELESPPLAEIVRDINKYSNNVMAQQLFLSLPLLRQGDGSEAAARAFLLDWARPWLAEEAASMVIDNGSGLSRDNRVSALALARLLQRAWASPNMPELASSLPVSGEDGTMRRSLIPNGRAHLKTGSLRDVAGIAGYVLADNGRRYIVVGIINHANAIAGRNALELLTRWAITSANN